MTLRKRQSLVRRILAEHERARGCYEKAELLFELLKSGTPIGEKIQVPAGEFEIVDNFATKNVHYRPARVNRFELKKVPQMPRRPAAPQEVAA